MGVVVCVVEMVLWSCVVELCCGDVVDAERLWRCVVAMGVVVCVVEMGVVEVSSCGRCCGDVSCMLVGVW
jgi:hypothetical protein